MKKKPHLRLHSDGSIYLFRDRLQGWKHVGFLFFGSYNWRRTSWPDDVILPPAMVDIQ